MRFGDVMIERRVPCVMRDGITLYSDIYMTNNTGTYPVLLMRQPYGRAIASTVSHAHPVWYAQNGYIVVIQDVRGRGDSEGEFTPFVQETADGYDTVEWAAALPGSNGKVGMYGFSYQGITQWAAAAEEPPALKAIAPSMCPSDLYHGTFYPHGSFALGDKLPWAFQLARDTAKRAGDNKAMEYCSQVMRHPEDLLYHMPVAESHPILDQYFPTYYDWVGHTEYDEYWQERNWLPKLKARKPIPALHIGGWYDSYLLGTLQSFEAFQDAPRTTDSFQRLIIGPWAHIPWGRMAGGVDHGADADGGIHKEQLRWFDYWLKGTPDETLLKEAPVRYFEQESRQWRTADRLPAAGKAAAQRFYLSGADIPSNGTLSGGKLKVSEADIEAAAAPDVFVYDARLPMKSEGYLPAERTMLQDRYEILVYTSDALAASLFVFGSPHVTVQCQTLAGPTDLVATLSAVSPEGKARFLSIGVTEICSEDAQDGNDWTEASIAMRPIAAEIPAGSAIRLELTGSAFPLFARHPNGVRAADKHKTAEDGLLIASVAVKSAEGAASYIELPIKEGGE